jgi:cell division inhibitor SepF
MAGVWKKTLSYLGLVEEDAYEELEEVGPQAEPAEVRRFARPQPVREVPADTEGIVRTIPATRTATATAIHKAEPKRFNEARDIGERFRQGIPVIMSLQATEDAIARRLVDFASGLVFGLDGKIEMVASRVYLLTPADMEVSAEERERLVEGGFFNQF